MFFPVSGIAVNPFVAFGVARVISFFTAMGGVSGAFGVLSFQVNFLGYSAPSVSAANRVFNIVAAPAGGIAISAKAECAGPSPGPSSSPPCQGCLSAPGCGSFICRTPKGQTFCRRAAAQPRLAPAAKCAAPPRSSAGRGLKILQARWPQLAFEYDGASHRFSPLVVDLACFWVDIAGGSIAAPFLRAIVCLPVHTIAGSALMGTFVTSVAGVGF
jgi:hypothetical protein